MRYFAIGIVVFEIKNENCKNNGLYPFFTVFDSEIPQHPDTHVNFFIYYLQMDRNIQTNQTRILPYKINNSLKFSFQ